MKQLLSVDMEATQEVVILRELLAFEEATFSIALQDPDTEEKDKPRIQARLDAIKADQQIPDKDDDPRISIGYLPPAKRSELYHRHTVAMRGKTVETIAAEDLDGYDDIVREWVRWGVRAGRNLPFPVTRVEVSWRGKKHQVLSDETMDQLQLNGLLHVLKKLVEQFNTLDEEKKSP
jgi:hypothetical protein